MSSDYSFVFIDGVAVLAGPPGYKVNLAHPTQQHYAIAYFLFGFTVTLSSLCLAQYIYVKLRILHKIDAQLVFLILGYLSSMVIAIEHVRGYATKVTGVHIWEMPIMRALHAAKMLLVVSALNAFTTGLCKTSLGLFYYHISPKRWWKWANGISIFLVASYNAIVFIIVLLNCRPIQKTWIPTLPGVCINQPALYIARAAFGLFTDLGLLILPIPMIVKLQIPTRQKVALVLFFSLGAITMITAAARVVTLLPSLHTIDRTWEYSSTGLITLTESQLVVICAALPTMKQFIARFAPSLLGESHSSKSSKSFERIQKILTDSFKTIGGKSSRRRVDEFGFTIDDDASDLNIVSAAAYQSQNDGTNRTSSVHNDVWVEMDEFCESVIAAQQESHRGDGQREPRIYDASWLEVMCDESFNKSFV